MTSDQLRKQNDWLASLLILQAHHDCHLHPDPSVTEGVCCVCDAEQPCDYALERDA